MDLSRSPRSKARQGKHDTLGEERAFGLDPCVAEEWVTPPGDETATMSGVPDVVRDVPGGQVGLLG